MPLKYNGKNIILAKKTAKKMQHRRSSVFGTAFLSKYPVQFQRQKAIDSFIADFYCHRAKLVIEIDGSQHYSETGLANDQFRTEVLSGYNLQVIRFTNQQINNRFQDVCNYIDTVVKELLSYQ